MLYNNGFESYKERNLYYKFFAGFFFNELIQGHQDRLDELVSYIKSKSDEFGGTELGFKGNIKAEESHVSFDNYNIQIEKAGIDRGEFADIFMHNLTCNALFSIEVKYLENWNYKRDIENVYKRLAKIKHLLEKSGSQPLQIIQCLLITQQKWGNVKSQISKESKSQFCKFQELSQNQKPIILIWEDILNFPSVANNHVVTDYMSRQLNLNKQTSKYYAEHGHLVR